MGLATIEPHGHEVQTKLSKSPSLVKIDPKVSKTQPFENVKIYKEMYGHSDTVRQSVWMMFLNRCISVKTSPTNTKLGNLVNLNVLFLTMWITNC